MENYLTLCCVSCDLLNPEKRLSDLMAWNISRGIYILLRENIFLQGDLLNVTII